MKYLILFLILIISSCTVIQVANTNTGEYIIGEYKIVNIDGCQYIWKYDCQSGSVIMTHKGDCTNSIHTGSSDGK